MDSHVLIVPHLPSTSPVLLSCVCLTDAFPDWCGLECQVHPFPTLAFKLSLNVIPAVLLG